jgi:hypothetical protein
MLSKGYAAEATCDAEKNKQIYYGLVEAIIHFLGKGLKFEVYKHRFEIRYK